MTMMSGTDSPAGTDDGTDADVYLLPCSFAQQRMWLLEQLEEGAPTYNVELGVRFTGPFAPRVLASTLTELVRRHEILRTTFELDDGELVQVISPPTETPVTEIDLSGRPAPEAALRALAAEQLSVRFDTERGPLLRATLVRLGQDDHVLLLVLDHLLCDGASVGVLYAEITGLYAAFLDGRPLPPEPAVQYGDYTVWQRELFEGPVLDRQLAFWRDRLADPPERPVLLRRPAGRTPRPRSHRAPVPDEVLAALDGWALSRSASRVSALQAGYHALLARYTGASDLMVGTLLANRTRAELEGLVGFFVNTAVSRVAVGDDPDADTLLRRTHDAMLDAHANQDVPFDRVVEELNPERTGDNPFFDVMFQYADQSLDPVWCGDTVLEPHELAAAPAPVTLVLNLVEEHGRVHAVWDYDGATFDDGFVTAMHDHYVRLLAGMAQDPARPVGGLPVLSDAEVAALAPPRAPEQPSVRLHEVFCRQAAARPDDIALVVGANHLTFRELDRRSNQLAHWLRGQGVRADRLVGVCLPKGVDLVVAVLAVSKAGGGYLPLDPAYPDDRLAHMVDDAAPVLVLTTAALRHRVTVPKDVALDRLYPELDGYPDTALPRRGTTSDDIAYVIYTSGSTGRPKGVAVTHRGLSTVVAAQRRLFRLGPDDRVLQFLSPSFDASVFELLTAFGAGARLHVSTEDSAGTADLARVLRDNRITAATLPPAAVAPLGAVDLPDLRVLNVAGEACPPGLAATWAETTRFHNLYGPTEATIWSTSHHVHRSDAARATVPIGGPVPGVSVRVLDSRGRLAPVGVWGELYIGGPVLARGYLGRPALTAARFVPDEWGAPGARLYRTGDVARWTSTGVLEFGGRSDEQVKVRGYRIELGEVTSVLAAHDEVGEAVVIAATGAAGDTRLVGYVTTTGDVTGEDLRAFCRRTLPEYMVPAAVVVLDRMPVTANGKVDRAALPEPAAAQAAGGFVAPESEVDRLLADLWAEVLGTPKVGMTDDFFELGGHSLLATLVVTRLRDEFDLDVPVRTLFDNSTLGAFADALLALVRS